jgi:hypothetical protein
MDKTDKKIAIICISSIIVTVFLLWAVMITAVVVGCSMLFE